MRVASKCPLWAWFALELVLSVPAALGVSAPAQAYHPVVIGPVGTDSAIGVAPGCFAPGRTGGGGLLIVCGAIAEPASTSRTLTLFPPDAAVGEVREESRRRTAWVERELALPKPTVDFPEVLVPGQPQAFPIISHMAHYRTELGFLAITTFTRVSPEGKVLFAVYAAGDAQKFADTLGLAMAQFADWHLVRPGTVPGLPGNDTTQSDVWGGNYSLLHQLREKAQYDAANSAENIRLATAKALPDLLGTWSGKSLINLSVYSLDMGMVDVPTPALTRTASHTFTDGHATLRVRPDGSYEMHSDWNFDGCRLVRDHEGTLVLYGDPSHRNIRLEASRYSERVERIDDKLAHASCSPGTSTKAPMLQFEWSREVASSAARLRLTRVEHEVSDPPSRARSLELVLQPGK